MEKKGKGKNVSVYYGKTTGYFLPKGVNRIQEAYYEVSAINGNRKQVKGEKEKRWLAFGDLPKKAQDEIEYVLGGNLKKLKQGIVYVSHKKKNAWSQYTGEAERDIASRLQAKFDENLPQNAESSENESESESEEEEFDLKKGTQDQSDGDYSQTRGEFHFSYPPTSDPHVLGVDSFTETVSQTNNFVSYSSNLGPIPGNMVPLTSANYVFPMDTQVSEEAPVTLEVSKENQGVVTVSDSEQDIGQEMEVSKDKEESIENTQIVVDPPVPMGEQKDENPPVTIPDNEKKNTDVPIPIENASTLDPIPSDKEKDTDVLVSVEEKKDTNVSSDDKNDTPVTDRNNVFASQAQGGNDPPSSKKRKGPPTPKKRKETLGEHGNVEKRSRRPPKPVDRLGFDV